LHKGRKGGAYGTLSTTFEIMGYLIVGLLIHFAVQTVFLLAALWIMIKIQKLNHNVLGLIGAAVLASAIDMVPLPFRIAHFISCAVLLLCITKVTRAEYVDVSFTVFVGYALMFGMNLFLLGSLLGDLRPSAREAENHQIEQEMEQDDDDTAKPRQAAAVATNRTPLAAKSQTVKPQTAKTPEQPLPPLSVKSLIRNGAKSSVTLQSDSDSRIIFLGDSELVHTATGSVKVRFDGLTNEFVLLTVGDQQVKLTPR
jgi:hypothetical protein